MKCYSTDQPFPRSSAELLYIYNGLDCCITIEVLEALLPQLDEVTGPVYDHERALQGVVLEMDCRGVLVDLNERDTVAEQLYANKRKLSFQLARILEEGLGLSTGFKLETWEKWTFPNSPKQLKNLFYTVMRLTPQRKKGKITVGRPALERLQSVFVAEPIIRHVLALRDITKKLSFLRTGIDRDQRIRTSFNIAGTDTFRFASYESPFGSGTNLQNVTEELRRIFVADPGYKFAYIDLRQVQSYIVGASIWNLLHDGLYLDACESGDLHTMVCRLCWPELPWSADYRANRAIADQDFYRVDSYRQASKKLGHATNFFGKPPEISRQVHIPLGHVIEFQKRYFTAFPGIRARMDEVKKLLLRQGFITTMCGQRRKFFGRVWDDDVLKQALAFEPQAVESFILNSGMLRIWRSGLPLVPMLQGHDSLVLQFPEEREAELVPQAMELMLVDVPLLYNRTLRVPVEALTGWNWSKARNDKKEVINPDGLEPFGNDKRERQGNPQASFLDRRF